MDVLPVGGVGPRGCALGQSPCVGDPAHEDRGRGEHASSRQGAPTGTSAHRHRVSCSRIEFAVSMLNSCCFPNFRLMIGPITIQLSSCTRTMKCTVETAQGARSGTASQPFFPTVMQVREVNFMLSLLLGAASCGPVTSLHLTVSCPEEAHLRGLAALCRLRDLEIVGLSNEVPVKARLSRSCMALPNLCRQLVISRACSRVVGMLVCCAAPV